MRENAFEKTFSGIEQAAAQRIKVNEGDYLDDEGLLVCCKCNTRKQAKIELFGIVRTPYCLCKCEAEKRDREREEFWIKRGYNPSYYNFYNDGLRWSTCCEFS